MAKSNAFSRTAFAAILTFALLDAARAAAQAPGAPPDEGVRVQQLTVDATAGTLVSVPTSANARSLAARDNTSEANATTVDPVAGVFDAGPSSVASSLGAVDHASEVAQLTVDAVAGVLIAGAPSSANFGAVNHAADVALVVVDATAGTFISGPSSSTTSAVQGAVDLGFLLNSVTVDAATGTLIAGPPAFAFGPATPGPALPLVAVFALVGLLALSVAWRPAA